MRPFSKAARGRPEGPTERCVFKFIFVMLAVFQLRIRQKYKVEVCHVTGGKVCQPMAEKEKVALALPAVQEKLKSRASNSKERDATCGISAV